MKSFDKRLKTWGVNVGQIYGSSEFSQVTSLAHGAEPAEDCPAMRWKLVNLGCDARCPLQPDWQLVQLAKARFLSHLPKANLATVSDSVQR